MHAWTRDTSDPLLRSFGDSGCKVTSLQRASFFAVAFGVYPHLNIADAAFVVVRNGVETALHASRCLNMERMDIVAAARTALASRKAYVLTGATKQCFL